MRDMRNSPTKTPSSSGILNTSDVELLSPTSELSLESESEAGLASRPTSPYPIEPYVFPTHRLKNQMHDPQKIPIVIVACGSYSPVTYLHLRMFEMARDYVDDHQKYEIMAGYFSPVSDAYNKPGLAHWQHRVKMCELAVEDSSWLMVDSWEASSKTYCRTLTVLNHFNELVNGPDLSGMVMADGSKRFIQVLFLAGGDLIQSFGERDKDGNPKWGDDDVNMILGNFGCLIIERTGTDVKDFLLKDDRLFRHRKNVEVIKQYIHNDISSTKIRLFLKREMSVKYLLPDPVIEYILACNLYKT